MPTDFEWVKKRLDEVYTVNSLQQVRELSQMRLILFSDVHKGQRDGADDFTQCEAIYVAALEHYWQQGFELWLLGDIEELWECRPQRTVAAYRNVLEIEQRFAAARNPRRYVRVVGNHDDLWYDPAAVARHLGPYVAGSEVEEGVRVTVQEAGETLGELFLVHGHQGTLLSDRYRTLSRWLVRIFWRPLQRLLRIKSNTPRNDFEVREEHEQHMYDWAASYRGRVLIAGHTHHPVWEGLAYQQALAQKARRAGSAFVGDPLQQAEQARMPISLPGERPVYFNTGCCSFSDGSITGLEIEDGAIRLVYWEDGQEPARQVLFEAALADVLRAVA